MFKRSMEIVKRGTLRGCLGKVAICLVLMTVPGLPRALRAQENSPSFKGNTWWFTGGFGGGSDKYLGTVMLSSHTSIGLIAFRYTLNFEGLNLAQSPEESVEDWGLLRGLYVQKDRRGFVALSGGISFVRTTSRGKFLRHTSFGDDYEDIQKTTAGLIIHGQFGWTPLPFLGFGLDIPVDVNTEHSFVGIALSTHLGILWPLANNQ